MYSLPLLKQPRCCGLVNECWLAVMRISVQRQSLTDHIYSFEKPHTYCEVSDIRVVTDIWFLKKDRESLNLLFQFLHGCCNHHCNYFYLHWRPFLDCLDGWVYSLQHLLSSSCLAMLKSSTCLWAFFINFIQPHGNVFICRECIMLVMVALPNLELVSYYTRVLDACFTKLWYLAEWCVKLLKPILRRPCKHSDVANTREGIYTPVHLPLKVSHMFVSWASMHGTNSLWLLESLKFSRKVMRAWVFISVHTSPFRTMNSRLHARV